MASARESWSRLISPLMAFSKKIFQSKTQTSDIDRSFGSWESRRLRYEVNWALYENVVYDDINSWAQSYRTQYGLPREIEGYYNPAYRLAEFWVAHIWGGLFDKELRDGEFVDTSLPFKFENENVQKALAEIYHWSNWQIKKDIFTLWGSVLGDVFLRIVDDTQEEKVYFEIIHPGVIAELVTNRQGYIEGYTLIEERFDPTDPEGNRVVEYKEVVTQSEDTITFETFKDNSPYAWYDTGETWSEDYGFVPLVRVQHKNVGLDWGWAEAHFGRRKIHNLDQMATSFTEFIVNSVKAPWLFSGVKKPNSNPKTTVTEPTADNPHGQRDDMRVLYGPAGSTAQHLVSPLELEDALNYLEAALKEIEKDYPELAMDIWNASKETSARALRIARQKTEKKAIQRRASYDVTLIRANMMALSIMAMNGYGEQGEALPEDGFTNEDFKHELLTRPVFVIDELEDLEIETAFWSAARAARDAGFTLVVWLERKGWTKEEIKKLTDSEEYQNRIALQSLALDQPILNPGGDRGGRPSDKSDSEKKEKKEKAVKLKEA